MDRHGAPVGSPTIPKSWPVLLACLRPTALSWPSFTQHSLEPHQPFHAHISTLPLGEREEPPQCGLASALHSWCVCDDSHAGAVKPQPRTLVIHTSVLLAIDQRQFLSHLINIIFDVLAITMGRNTHLNSALAIPSPPRTQPTKASTH